MTQQDLLVREDGDFSLFEIDLDLESSPYRLYRFLTDLEDLTESSASNEELLKKLCPLVRRLLTQSASLQLQYNEPDPKTGWSVSMLYDEPDFPITVQNVVWNPGMVSPIHNHGTWGVVAILDGQEKNIFWKPNPNAESGLEKVKEVILNPGDIITFLPNTIHRVEAISDEPVVSFNLYGETDYKSRFQFDLETGTKKNF